MNKRFFITCLRYLEASFHPEYFLLIIEVMLSVFGMAQISEFDEYESYLIEFHSLFSTVMIIFIVINPYMSKIIKFKPVSREMHLITEFNFPNRVLGIFAIVSMKFFSQYPYIALIIAILSIIVYVFDEQNTLLQAIISFAFGVLLYIMYTLFPKYYKATAFALSMFFVSRYLIGKWTYKEDKPGGKNKFFSTLMKTLGFVWFDVICTVPSEKKVLFKSLALLASFMFHVLAHYVSSKGWVINKF